MCVKDHINAKTSSTQLLLCAKYCKSSSENTPLKVKLLNYKPTELNGQVFISKILQGSELNKQQTGFCHCLIGIYRITRILLLVHKHAVP